MDPCNLINKVKSTVYINYITSITSYYRRKIKRGREQGEREIERQRERRGGQRMCIDH